ncbi:hypothetical protein FXO38_26174 [Capsicum annuum]|nr:hypothetical protein FXO38_26174 [Capsicum annuum]
MSPLHQLYFNVVYKIIIPRKKRITEDKYIDLTIMELIDTKLRNELADALAELEEVRATHAAEREGLQDSIQELKDDLAKERAENTEIICKHGYGMTEAGAPMSMCLAFAKEPFEIKSGACGTVIRNAEMKIVDPDTGISLPRNKPGEICIRGDQIMKG